MSIGPTIRRSLGRFEQPAADAYRAAFFNVQHFVERCLQFAPDARRILEIGCGDGDVASALVAAYPGAEYTGIDPAPEAGRRFQGDTMRAQFWPLLSHQFRQNGRDPYDLVVVADVLHHIPDIDDRAGVLADATAMLADGGTLLVKEWEQQPTPAYWAGWVADYYVSGDKRVRYATRSELTSLFLPLIADGVRHDHTVTVRPWRCNVVHVLRKATP